MANISGLNISADGELLATISDDMSMKVFDITNFGNLPSPFVNQLISLVDDSINELFSFFIVLTQTL